MGQCLVLYRRESVDNLGALRGNRSYVAFTDSPAAFFHLSSPGSSGIKLGEVQCRFRTCSLVSREICLRLFCRFPSLPLAYCLLHPEPGVARRGSPLVGPRSLPRWSPRHSVPLFALSALRSPLACLTPRTLALHCPDFWFVYSSPPSLPSQAPKGPKGSNGPNGPKKGRWSARDTSSLLRIDRSYFYPF